MRLKERLSVHRRMALGTWSAPDDPTVHGTLTLRAEPMLAYLDALQGSTGQRVTLTTAVVKAFGTVQAEVPDTRAMVRWGRIYIRDNIDVFVHVAFKDPVTGRHDLSGLTLRNVDQKSMVTLAEEMEAGVQRVRHDADPALRKTRDRMRELPQFLMKGALDATAFFSYTLNLDLSALGGPKDPFGSVGVTNIGALGLDTAYVPLVPYSRLPMIVAVGAVQTVPVVEGDAVVPGKVVSLHATFDHRLMDGSQLAVVADVLRRVFANPEAEYGPAAR